MWPRPSVSFGLLVVVLAGGCLGAPTTAPASTRQASVLILLPGQPGLPAASLIATGIRSSLIAEWSFRVGIEVEHVDIALFPSPELEERRLRTLVGSKYANRTFDLIIAASHEPLHFVLRQRDELWPGVPVIVCAVDERSVRDLAVPADVRLVTIRYDVDGTLRAALALLPDTERVALAGGAGPQERVFHDLARQAVTAADRRLDLIDLTALPIADLMARVSVLPEHTIVLASSYQVDATGRRLYGLDIIGPLTRAANRPTFNMFNQVLGRGIVGGSMTDFEAIGREAGALGLRALRGEAWPGAPLASAVASVPRFDARQLARWRLDERRLVPGSEVLHREPTLWQEYRWAIAGVIGLIGVQAGLIIALLVQRGQRREAQALLAERLRFEHLVNEVATTLASASIPRLDGQIRECLQRVATFIDVDRGALWQLSPDGSVISPSHVWHREGAPPPATIDLRVFTYLRARTAPGQEGLRFTRLGDLPPEAAAERAAFEAQGVRSLATVPLAVGDRLLGLLAFVRITGERAWPPELMQQLRTLADHFAHAVVRAQSAAAVESSAALAGAILAALPGETAIIDSAGVILQTNETWLSAARSVSPEFQPALAVGANYLETCRRAVGMPADTAWKVHALLEDILRGAREEFAHEYPTSRPGGDRWLEIRVRRLAYLGGGAAVTHFDVTARRQAEADARRHLSQIAHLDRVASMGQLASSLAHELNQPLTAILSNAQTARRLLARPSLDLTELGACIADIIDDDRRAAEVIRHVRRLLKKTDFTSLPFALNDLTATTIGLVSNDALLHGVTIEFRPASVLPIVYGDVVQIQQVILNLLANAIAAASGGSTARKVVVWSASVPPYIEVGVHDSGPGIPAADLERLFEPFFTTKDEGLGLGLAISRTIVDAHGWRLLVENDPAGGATFRVQLRTDPPPTT